MKRSLPFRTGKVLVTPVRRGTRMRSSHF